MRATWLESEKPMAMSELLAQGVHYEQWPTKEGAYQTCVDVLMEARGYVEQDIIDLSEATPGLDALCERFIDEHLHSDDEVRFVLAGEGIFDIRSTDDRWMRVLVEAGDLIVVAAKRHHRFLLTDQRRIRCVRLFKDRSGWVPEYRRCSEDTGSVSAVRV
ncbi:MAG: acireductone dioxygenase [Deltaproteobacteria bacterium CG2_30_63_29]|nr:MAG: acireductone dioxygenase [Deltaproteobacteria bacterium CG2_30_63_29]PIW00566.1 MAG: acireductone dioxygenase [Deltaproteobacteria bacterium CG17_big_fil_post_rev_8_21_14_2_50_63_7]PJB37379.1 MAG: acireductone dioxygenase [Deltaproteobacteria bacterium CG_4_9_14_3_um_filter_63_12]